MTPAQQSHDMAERLAAGQMPVHQSLIQYPYTVLERERMQERCRKQEAGIIGALLLALALIGAYLWGPA